MGLDEVEYRLQAGNVVAGQRHSQPDPLAELAQPVERRHRPLERPGQAAEMVVHLADAVEADADVGEAGPGDQRGQPVVDQSAVGGQRGAEALARRVCDQLQQVGPGGRLAAGEENGRDLEIGQVVQHPPALLGGQFAGVVSRLAVGVAVQTAEVALAGDVPDDDRAALSRGPGSRLVARPGPPVANGVAGAVRAAIKLADVDHLWTLGYPCIGGCLNVQFYCSMFK